MAITNNSAKFLFYARHAGVFFEDTLTLGRLQMYVTRQSIQESINTFQKDGIAIKELNFLDEYAEPFIKILGAKSVNSLDYSDYEKATLVHDLNVPIPDHLRNRFTAVIDCGTIEHVFNFPIAIKNCMEAVKLNGHFISVTPVNNQMGHGFYQFSPELYYRVFSKENGFEIVKMIICVHSDEQTELKWYEVADPKMVNKRVTLVNNLPTSLLFIAKKTHEATIFNHTPQQSDYTTAWLASDNAKSGKKPERVSTVKHVYKKLVPKKIKVFFRNTYDAFTKEKEVVGDLGYVDPNHFKEFKL